jgi:hypothetical protein
MEPYNPATRTIISDRSPASAAVDNLLRRSLKISDPRNAEQVAKGLLERYPEEAAKIKREQMGLPFSVMAVQPAPVVPVRVGRPEIAKASDMLERALTELTTSPDVADIVPEMRGWATTIRRAAADGFSSASYAIDAGERDRAFAARRTLGDYGRLSRYVAAVNNCATEIYCRVAQACDLVANVVLVLVGDALGDAGITRSGALIQVPTAVLQARRDGVIIALRNLLMLTPSGDQEEWPRSTVALQQIYEGLDQAGAPDLRALLDEAHLARQLDDLIDLATGSTSDGLRALGSTAVVTVQRLRRFLILATSVVQEPKSPPATTFFAELGLFIQSFDNTHAGYRLPYLARSPLLVSGFSATQSIDPPTRRLLELALQRTALADAIDCLCCSCNAEDTEDLVVAGQVLVSIDRAIDLYALGIHPKGLGDAEWAAAATGALVLRAFGNDELDPAPAQIIGPIVHNDIFDNFQDIPSILQWSSIIDTVPDPTPFPPASDEQKRRSRQLAAVINTMVEEEKRWAELVSSITPLCHQDLLFNGIPGTQTGPRPTDPIGRLLQATTDEIDDATDQWGEFNVRKFLLKIGLPQPIATNQNFLIFDKSES